MELCQLLERKKIAYCVHKSPHSKLQVRNFAGRVPFKRVTAHDLAPPHLPFAVLPWLPAPSADGSGPDRGAEEEEESLYRSFELLLPSFLTSQVDAVTTKRGAEAEAGTGPSLFTCAEGTCNRFGHEPALVRPVVTHGRPEFELQSRFCMKRPSDFCSSKR